MKRFLLVSAALLLVGVASVYSQVVAPQPPRPVGRPIGRPVPLPGGDELPQVKVTKEQLPNLIKDLESNDPATLLTAVTALGELGPDAAKAVPGLIRALGFKNEDVRLNAAIALGRVGKAAVDDLTKSLASDDADVRFYSVWALGWIGPDAKTSANAVMNALRDKNDSVRRKAAYTLGRIGADPKPAIESLLAALGDEKEEVRAAAGESIAKFGEAAVPGLLAEVKRKESKGRLEVVKALGEIGFDARSAIPTLAELLESDEALRPALGETLGKIGRESISALVKALRSDNQNVRQVALNGLAKIGTAAGDNLIDALADKRVDVRRLAAQLLGPMNIGDRRVIEGLGAALKDEDDQVKEAALRSLQLMQQMGNNIRPAVPQIRDALIDNNPTLRQTAWWVLQSMNEDPRAGLKKGLESQDERVRVNTAALMLQMNFEVQQANPILRDALTSKNLNVRMQAAYSLAQRRQELQALIPVLIQSLKDGKVNIRSQALQAIQFVGAQAQAALPGVLEALKDDEPSIRQLAVMALLHLQADPKTVIPALEKALEDKESRVRLMVMTQSFRLQERALPLYLKGLQDKDSQVRQQAIQSLGNVRGDPKAIIPEFERLMDDTDVNVRRAVTSNLWRYQAQAMPVILKGLQDPDFSVRQQCLWALQNTRGAEPGKVIPVLTKLAETPDVGVKVTVAQVAGVYGKEAVPVFAQLLKDTNEGVRQQAVWNLQNYNIDIKSMLPQLLDLLKEKNPNIRNHLFQMLPRAGQEAVPILVKSLESEEEQVRQLAVQALAQIRNTNKEVNETIFKMAREDKSPTVRGGAIAALMRLEPGKTKELAELLSKETDATVRTIAVRGIASNDDVSQIKPLLPILIECLKDKNDGLQNAALQTCFRLGQNVKETVPAIANIVKDSKNTNTRILAIRTLGQMGAEAREAVPVLQAAARDSNPTIVRWANMALKKIGTP